MSKFLLIVGAALLVGAAHLHGVYQGVKSEQEKVRLANENGDMTYVPGAPTYVEVQCDAFDLKVFPHDEPSRSDAEEFAENFSLSEACHVAL